VKNESGTDTASFNIRFGGGWVTATRVAVCIFDGNNSHDFFEPGKDNL